MKKTSFFAQKRLTYVETPDHPAVSSARAEVENRVRGIEDDLKSGKNVEQATEAAKFFVREAGRNATAKLQADWELRKEKEKYIDYLKQVEELVETTITKIAKNKDRYDRLAKFVAKKTEMEAMLEKNRVFFEGNVKGRHDLNNIAVLNQIADSLALTHSEIERMPLDDPDMEVARTTLNVSISEQMMEFDTEIEATREYHKKKLAEAEAFLADVYKPLTLVGVEDEVWVENAKKTPEELNVRDDEGRLVGEARPADGRTTRFHDQSARKAWQHLIYVKDVRAILGGVPDETDLVAAAEKASSIADKVEPLLLDWDQKHYLDRGKENDKRMRAWAQLPALEANLARARANLAELEKKGASAEERFKARQWVAGAMENVQKQLAVAHDVIYKSQEINDGLSPSDMPPMAVATRWGTTEVEHMGRGKPAEEPVTPEPEYVAMPEMGVTAEPPETAPPRIASAEEGKKKREKKG